MKTNNTMAAFPLSLAVIPGELIPLHLFEPRYRQLLEDVDQSSKEFVIVYSKNGQLADYATIVTLESVATRYENGTSDIIIKGKSLVKIIEYYPQLGDKLYPGVMFEPLLIVDTIESETQELFHQYEQRKKSNKVIPQGLFELALRIDLSQEQQLQLISSESNQARNKIIRGALLFEDKIHQQITMLDGNYHLN